MLQVDLLSRGQEIGEISYRFTRGDHTQPRVLAGQLADQDGQRGVFELASFNIQIRLERFHAIEQQQRLLAPHQVSQPLSFVPGRTLRRVSIAKPFQRFRDKNVRGGDTFAGSLAVKRPGKHAPCAAIIVRGQLLAPFVDQRGFAHSTPGHETDHVCFLRRPGVIEQFQFILPSKKLHAGDGQAVNIHLLRRWPARCWRRECFRRGIGKKSMDLPRDFGKGCIPIIFEIFRYRFAIARQHLNCFEPIDRLPETRANQNREQQHALAFTALEKVWNFFLETKV